MDGLSLISSFGGNTVHMDWWIYGLLDKKWIKEKKKEGIKVIVLLPILYIYMLSWHNALCCMHKYINTYIYIQYVLFLIKPDSELWDRGT